jgi:hypothetical protein
MSEFNRRREGLDPRSDAYGDLFGAEAKALAALDPLAHALENFAFDQGLRRFVGQAIAEEYGLKTCGDGTNSPAVMARIIRAQRRNLATHVLGASQAETDKINTAHMVRCDRTDLEMRAGNIQQIAWY